MNLKKYTLIAITGIMLISLSVAQEKTTMSKNWKDSMTMMPHMSMVAVDGGGVVVMVGHKLFKFDSNMKLRSEGKLPIDREHIKEMMNDMKNMYNIMKEMYPSMNHRMMN